MIWSQKIDVGYFVFAIHYRRKAKKDEKISKKFEKAFRLVTKKRRRRNYFESTVYIYFFRKYTTFFELFSNSFELLRNKKIIEELKKVNFQIFCCFFRISFAFSNYSSNSFRFFVRSSSCLRLSSRFFRFFLFSLVSEGLFDLFRNLSQIKIGFQM